MKRFFWINGRLSWPLVISILYVTAALIIFDYVWRVAVIPFNALMIYALVTIVALAILLLGFYQCVRWWRKQSG